MADDYRFGIEEEYFLADADTGRSPSGEAADRFHEAAEKVAAASHELLKGQIEVCTEPGTDHIEARRALHGLRTLLSALAGDHRLSLFAAGSHPMAEARAQLTTEKERYERIEQEFGIITSRAMVCAMHVHVEVPAPDERIGVIRRLVPYLPMFLALSVSSPFWQRRDSGLRGFRLCAFSEWPRMGLPELFISREDYETFVDLLVRAGRIPDASFIWWYLRPSIKFPTIELRICDSCTKVDDAVAIAAFFRCLVRALIRRPDINTYVGPIERGVCAENVWQAQRAGTGAQFVDRSRPSLVPVAEIVAATMDLIADDAEALDCADWVGRIADIVKRGTSADHQIATFHAAKAREEDDETALRSVVRELAKMTLT